MTDPKKHFSKNVIFKHALFPYLIVSIVIFILAAIEVPYRRIEIPREILIPAGVFTVIAAIYLAMENHYLLLLVLVSYMPFSKVMAGDFGGFMTGFNLTNILGGIVVIGWFVKRVIHEEPFYRYAPSDVPLLLYCFLVTLSIVRGGISNDYPVMDMVLEAKRYLTPFLFFYVFSSNINEEKHIHQILVTMGIAIAVVALMGIKEAILDKGPAGSYEKMRIEGITEQSNNLAAFFAYYSFIILAFLLFNWRQKVYWLLLLPLLACFMATTSTYSRGGVISFFAAFGCMSFLWSRWLFAGFIFLVVAIFVVPSAFPGRITGRFQGTNLTDPDKPMEKSARGRLEVWKAATQDMRNHFWLGIGYGQFLSRYIRDAHNEYILIAAEMGMPALMLWLVIIFILFWQSVWLYRNAASKTYQLLAMCFITAIAAILVSNIFGSRLNSQELSCYFWIMGGMTMAAVRMEKERIKIAAEYAAKGLPVPEHIESILDSGDKPPDETGAKHIASKRPVQEKEGETSVPHLKKW